MIVMLDFDGTIAVNDVCDALVDEFADIQQLMKSLSAGEVTVAEYYRNAFAAIADKCPPDTLTHWLSTQPLDPGFTSLISWLKIKDIPVRVVSDGFDIYIKPLLASVGLDTIPVFANVATWDGHAYVPRFPGATEGCTCFCASCKRNAVLHGIPDDEVVVYVGDGRSDACAVQFADIVFAKGYLASWCTAERIPHHPYKTLADVQRILANILMRNQTRQRRQATLARRNAYLQE